MLFEAVMFGSPDGLECHGNESCRLQVGDRDMGGGRRSRQETRDKDDPTPISIVES